jgi:hypothetical protein
MLMVMNDKTCAWCGEAEVAPYLKACGKDHYELVWGIPIYTRIGTKTAAIDEQEWLQRSLDSRKKLSSRADAIIAPKLYTV